MAGNNPDIVDAAKVEQPNPSREIHNPQRVCEQLSQQAIETRILAEQLKMRGGAYGMKQYIK